MARERIRVRLRGFDIELIDQSAKSIVQTVLKAGSQVSGPIPLPMRSTSSRSCAHRTCTRNRASSFEMRTPQAAHRHPRAHPRGHGRSHAS